MRASDNCVPRGIPSLSKNFTFICGEDDFLVSIEGKKAFETMNAELMDDLSREVIDGNAGKADEVVQVVARFIAAAQTLSLFGEKKTVWLRGVTFLADSVTGRAADTLEALERLQEFLETVDPQSVNVLITASPVDRRRSFYKWVEKTGIFQFLKSGNAKDLGLHIQKELQPMGVEIAPDALSLLLEKVCGNARLALAESVKLATYVSGAGSGRIEEVDVREMVPDPFEGDFFETTDVFFTGDLSGTLDSLRRYFFTNKEARPLLASLQSRNRLLIQLRTLLDGGEIAVGYKGVDKGTLESAGERYLSHYGESKAKSPLNVFTQNPWYLGKIAQQAGHLKLRKLVDFQVAFVDTFKELVRRSKEHEEVMQALAIRCLG